MEQLTTQSKFGKVAWWTVLLMFISTVAFGNNVQITNVSYTPSTNVLTFDLSWDNSWRDASGEFQDGVWIFSKYAPNGSPQWLHTPVDSAWATGNFYASIESDSTGTLLRRSTQAQGTASTTVTLYLGNLLGVFPDFKVFGIEMVKIPQGPYYLGGPATDPNVDRFHRGDDDQEAFHVPNSGILTAGNTVNDFGTTASFGYTTDIPADYPNGFDKFWSMKYKVTQEQYVEFLNTLTFDQQNARTLADLTTVDASSQFVMSNSSTVQGRNGVIADLTTANGGPITFYCNLNLNGIFNEVNDGQSVACNYVNYDDCMAYLDWAALRPLTCLEYEKACRGPLPAITDEYAWGSAAITVFNIADITNSGQIDEGSSLIGGTGPLIQYAARVGMTATDTSDRVASGAGYYGVHGLGSNLISYFVDAETTSSFGGLNFLGTHGDGTLNVNGGHTNADWPEALLRRGAAFNFQEIMVELGTATGASQTRDSDHGMRGGRN